MLESVFNKVRGLKTWKCIKKRFQHRCFPVKFAKFLKTLFTEHPQGLLFSLVKIKQRTASIDIHLLIYYFDFHDDNDDEFFL